MPQDHDSGATVPRLQLVLAAVLFSTGGAAIKATALTAMQVASLRSGIAALTLLALMPAARRGFGRRSVVIAAAYAATMILFVVANKWTTAASAIFLQATAPLYIMLLAPTLLGEPVRRRDVAFVAIMAGGMALFFFGAQEPAATAPRPVAGLVAGGLSGLTWALTIMGLRSGSRPRGGPATASRPARDPLATSVLLGNAFASAACLPFALPLPSFSAKDIVLILYLGIFQIGIAYALLTAGIRHVGALAASILLLAEPALSPFWAWLFHGEVPGMLSLAGGAIILGATIARTVLDTGRETQRAAEASP
jgi:drug/metabolite transporter (DMT)-like permease